MFQFLQKLPPQRRDAVLLRLPAIALVVLTLNGAALAQVASPPRPDRTVGSPLRWPRPLAQPPEWFDSKDAVRIADELLLYQNSNGGWPKNIDMSAELTDEQKADLIRHRDEPETMIDNGATYTQIRYLALVYNATHEERFGDACRRGVDFLLAAQYPNGGWAQTFPLQKNNYSSHITFNDGAMIGVMRLLRNVAAGKEPFAFLDADRRARSQQAIDKGLAVILKCQVVVDGKPTAWCAQHDEFDFKPSAARAYELPSLSGQESVGIVEYLMDLDTPSPEVKRAVEGAVAWFDAAKLEGIKVSWVRDDDLLPPIDRVVEDDSHGEPLWARFYAIGTNHPMFVGRDGVVHDHLADIEHERRTGYSYIGPYARDLLDSEYPAWEKKRNAQP